MSPPASSPGEWCEHQLWAWPSKSTIWSCAAVSSCTVSWPDGDGDGDGQVQPQPHPHPRPHPTKCLPNSVSRFQQTLEEGHCHDQQVALSPRGRGALRSSEWGLLSPEGTRQASQVRLGIFIPTVSALQRPWPQTQAPPATVQALTLPCIPVACGPDPPSGQSTGGYAAPRAPAPRPPGPPGLSPASDPQTQAKLPEVYSGSQRPGYL